MRWQTVILMVICTGSPETHRLVFFFLLDIFYILNKCISSWNISCRIVLFVLKFWPFAPVYHMPDPDMSSKRWYIMIFYHKWVQDWFLFPINWMRKHKVAFIFNCLVLCIKNWLDWYDSSLLGGIPTCIVCYHWKKLIKNQIQSVPVYMF